MIFSKKRNIFNIINCWDLTHEKFNNNLAINNIKKTNFKKLTEFCVLHLLLRKIC